LLPGMIGLIYLPSSFASLTSLFVLFSLLIVLNL
jgi:hypothetical protein